MDSQLALQPVAAPIFLNPDVEALPRNPFQLLTELLADVRPSNGGPSFNAAVGDPQGYCPAPVEVIAQNSGLWGRYPPLVGTPGLRESIVGWLNRRFKLSPAWTEGAVDILPVAGSREALFLAATLCVPRRSVARPVVLLPNPSYPGYHGSAVMAGAEPVLLPARANNGYLPRISDVGFDVLSRTSLMFVTNPTNPEGAAADAAYLKELIAVSEQHNFILAVDECCIDLYTRETPVGILSVCHDLGLSTERLLVFNSLSKRSNSAGLRSGFVAGGASLIANMRVVRSYTGATVPLPLQAASAALWSDDHHVDAIRADLDSKFALAEEILGRTFANIRPDAGFFLWLPVGDDLDLTRKLWSQGVRVMPGSLLGRGQSDDNPGKGHIRVALVHHRDEVEAILRTIAKAI